jgi:hypothetical protein
VPGDEKGRGFRASEAFLVPSVTEKRDLSFFGFNQRVHAADQYLVIADDLPAHQIRYLFQRVRQDRLLTKALICRKFR